jgi:hypothetical protein
LYCAESVTGKDYDIISEFANMMSRKWIDSDCYCSRPDLILRNYTGKAYSVAKTTATKANAEKADFVIGYYKWNSYGHFVVMDKNLNVVFDPLENSNTVKNGKLDSLRIFVAS